VSADQGGPNDSRPRSEDAAHRIRLHGPWWWLAGEVTSLDAAEPIESGASRIALPVIGDSLSLGLLNRMADESDIATAIRPYRVPSGLSDGQRVAFRLERPCGVLAILTDECRTPLDPSAIDAEVDLTSSLVRRSEVASRQASTAHPKAGAGRRIGLLIDLRTLRARLSAGVRWPFESAMLRIE